MDLTLMLKHKRLLAVAITGIAVLPSLFFGPKVLGIVLLFFFAAVVWNLYFLIKSIPNNAEVMSKEDGADTEKSKEVAPNKYAFAIPVMMAGLAVVFVQIFALIFLYP